MNSLFYFKNENISNIHQEFADNFLKNYFSRNWSKIIFSSFSVEFQIFAKLVRKLTENFPQKIIAHEFYKKNGQREFSVLFSSWMALSCPMISQSNCKKAGQDEWPIILYITVCVPSEYKFLDFETVCRIQTDCFTYNKEKRKKFVRIARTQNHLKPDTYLYM